MSHVCGSCWDWSNNAAQQEIGPNRSIAIWPDYSVVSGEPRGNFENPRTSFPITWEIRVVKLKLPLIERLPGSPDRKAAPVKDDVLLR